MKPKNCTECGYCCTLALRLSSDDIDRIKKLGPKESDFVEVRGATRHMKSVNNYCIFLEIQKGKARCQIYDARPRQCIDYPGTESCNLKRHITLARF